MSPDLYKVLHAKGMAGELFQFYTDGSCQYPSSPNSSFSSFATVVDLAANDQERIDLAKSFSKTTKLMFCHAH
jgi:hypothetical protein